MMTIPKQKVVVVGAGPVGSLAALYAASRGDDVEVYELRGGMSSIDLVWPFSIPCSYWKRLSSYEETL